MRLYRELYGLGIRVFGVYNAAKGLGAQGSGYLE